MIDILLATYQGEEYLREQIESIMVQTVADWNLYVSDDDSTDATLSIVRQYMQYDERIHLLPHTSRLGGACQNFMHLLGHSTAQYSMFCDQDDVWLPNKIELTLQKMRELEEEYTENTPLMVFTDMVVVDGDLEILRNSFEEQSYIDPHRTELTQLISAPVAAGCTMMINAPLREKTLETPKDQPIRVHDWWISMVAAAFGHIGHVDEPTSLYRQHESNVIGSEDYTNLRTFQTFNIDAAAGSIIRAIKHAESFADVYYDQLCARDKRRIDALLSVHDVPRILRIPRMIKGHSWKRGAIRKVGEAVVLFVMRMDDRLAEVM